MANIMKDVAKALGVELEEEFIVKDYDNTHKLNNTYKLTEDGLVYWSDDYQDWVNSDIFNGLLIGDINIVKLILTKKEREYLSNIVKPFKDRKVVIKKYEYPQNEHKNECIQISVEYYDKTGSETVSLPIFKKGTMYKGLESNKCYTLEELGL